ncbi:MAG: DUF2778 domain-containing protein [Pseudomonadota bacterium]|nr:DUF2778 domain-containing protein [Pseudomonadota bacterium]
MTVLVFYRAYGQLLVKEPSGSYFVPATSGRGSCTNRRSCESARDMGPIPAGRYYLYKSEINDPNFLWDAIRNITIGDWGDWRVPLHSGNSTLTYGRDGFFLHGGMFEGSAGCIDIGGGWFGDTNTNRVLKSIRTSEVSELWVA